MTRHINQRVNPNGTSRPKLSATVHVADTANIAVTAQVSDHASVTDYASVTDHASVLGHARVFGDAHVYGNAHVFGNANVLGYVRVYGDARLSQRHWVHTGYVTADLITDLAASIIAQTGLVVGPDGNVVGAKRVNATDNPAVFASLYDSSFLYTVGEMVRAPGADPDPLISCGQGLHVSHPTYYALGDTTIAVQFHLDDVLACQEGKVRVSKLTVLGKIGTTR